MPDLNVRIFRVDGIERVQLGKVKYRANNRVRFTRKVHQ
jgi:hypothetical protein